MLELIDSILQEKMDLNENLIKIKLFEIRVTNNISELETFAYIRIVINNLEKLEYNKQIIKKIEKIEYNV